MSRKKAVILDIDETLIHSFDAPDDIKNLLNEGIFSSSNYDLRSRVHYMKIPDVVADPGKGEIDHIIFVERPHLREFLQTVRDNFDYVIIWSAGRPRYVRNVVERIFRDVVVNHYVAHVPLGKDVNVNAAPLTLGRDVVVSNHVAKGTDEDHHRKGKIDLLLTSNDMVYYPDFPDSTKPVAKVVEKIPFISPGRIVAIDDRYTSFSHCNLANGILIPPYHPLPTLASIQAEDNSLIELSKWFTKNEIKNCSDYRKIDKTHIFG